MKNREKIINCLLAMLTTVAMLINYEKFLSDDLPITKPFRVETSITAIVFIGLLLFYMNVKPKKLHISKKVLSFLFSFFMVLGYSYLKTNSWDLVFGRKRVMLIALVSFIAYNFFFRRVFAFIDDKIITLKLKEFEINKDSILGKALMFFDERPFISSLIVLLVFWAIYMVAFYPIILSPDPSYQIKQFFNVHTKYADWVIQLDPTVNMTNHHPVLHTLLLGGCLKLGRALINDNFGLFIYSMVQTLILSSTLAYTIAYLKRIRVSKKVRSIILAIYALVPMFPFYAMSGVKDTIYTSFVILYIVFLFDFVKYKKEKKMTISQTIYLVIVLLLVALFRNNGLYVIILSMPFAIAYSKVNRKKTVVALLSFLCLFMCYSKVILPHFGISDGSIREALTIPFQQTARYVKYHEEDLTEQDKEVIDKILGYDTLAERYKPNISDPVKNEYNKYATTEDLAAYFKVWFKGLLKHPGTYIEATINNIYGYFYPDSSKWYIYYSFDSRITQDNLVDYSFNGCTGLRKILTMYGVSFPFLPFIGLIANIGINTWLLIIMGVYLFTMKKKEYLIVLAPLYVSVLICIASPVNTYFRYTMPYVFSMPMLIAMFYNVINTKRKDIK